MNHSGATMSTTPAAVSTFTRTCGSADRTGPAPTRRHPGARSTSRRRTVRDSPSGHRDPRRSPSSRSIPRPRPRRSPGSTPSGADEISKQPPLRDSHAESAHRADDRQVTDRVAVAEDRERDAEAHRETSGGGGDPSSVGADPTKGQPLSRSDHRASDRPACGRRPHLIDWSHDRPRRDSGQRKREQARDPCEEVSPAQRLTSTISREA